MLAIVKSSGKTWQRKHTNVTVVRLPHAQAKTLQR